MQGRKKKTSKEQTLSSFDINYKYQNDPQYPYLLACSLNRSTDQFQTTRSMKLLAQWVEEYAKLSQILKYKYHPYLPKIQKILLNKYLAKAPIQYCLGRFLIQFYQTSQDFTAAIKNNLEHSDRYSLDFMWYTCHSLVQDFNPQKQLIVSKYFTNQFEAPLRHYEPQQSIQARKLLEIVHLINIHGCQESFIKKSVSWSNKFQSFLQATSGDFKLILLMEVIKNRNILRSNQVSSDYWLKKVQIFFLELQSRVNKMSAQNLVDCQFLDLLIWVLDLPQVKNMLLSDQSRFLKSLLSSTRPKQDNPDNIFHLPKYKEIKQMLYNMFFETDSKSTKIRLLDLLQKFTTHSYFIMNEQNNFIFLDCLSERNIQLQQNVVNQIIKVLSNNHIRRTLTAKVIMVLAKTITVSLDGCELSDQVVGQCLKAFSDSIFHKTTDPMIQGLRTSISRLFLAIMQRYCWQEGYKNDLIFNLCDQIEKNSSTNVNNMVFEMLYLLIKKFGFNNETKLQPLLTDIFDKTLTNQKQLHWMVSLLIVVAKYMKFPKAIILIQQICAKSSSTHSAFYLFQALALIQEHFQNQSNFKTVCHIVSSYSHWDSRRIDINLMMLEIYFLKVLPSEALPMLRKIDKDLCTLFKNLYSENNYRLLSLIAAKTLPAIGGDPETMQSFSSYQWIRQFSFQMLARSFYKTTSINVCYIYSNIILRSQKPVATIRWLAKEQFLDYLYQGLNDFISKQKIITLEIATTVLTYKLFRNQPSLVPVGSKIPEFSTLVKNVSWWDEDHNPIHFIPFEENCQNNSWILSQFRVFYEETIQEYFQQYFKNVFQKHKAQEERYHLAHQQEI